MRTMLMSECKHCGNDDKTYTHKEVFGMTEVLKSENTNLKAERDKWETDHELLVTDYKQLLIDLSKKDEEIKILEAENERLVQVLRAINDLLHTKIVIENLGEEY